MVACRAYLFLSTIPGTRFAARHAPAGGTPERRRLKILALAMCWMMSGSIAYAAADAVPAHTHADLATVRHTFNIPAGSLDRALSRFGRQSGVTVSVNAALTAGVESRGVHGSHTVAQALRQLLAGTGLEAVHDAVGEYTLRHAPGQSPDGVGTLAPVTVLGSAGGGADAGYVTRGISAVGPWEGRDLRDTPYAISAVPADLIENIQATTPDQIFRMMPTTQLSWPQSQNDAPYIFMRGFQSTTPARNGLPGAMYGHGTSTEDIERVEILTGLSGFLYGPGNVGGLVNYVSKRPTPARYNSVTVGNSGGPNAYAHGDFGGPIDAGGRFGYRVNTVAQGGRTLVDDYTLRRKFVSAAFDWRPTDRLLVQVDGSHRRYRSTRQAYWAVASGARRPDADSLDPNRLWSQDWTFFDVTSKRLGANLRWEATDAIALRAGYLHRRDVREYAFSTNTIQRDGTYKQANRITAPQDIRGNAWHAFVDFAFDTGPVTHKLTVGYLATSNTRYDHADGQVSAPLLSGLSLDRPFHVPEPQWPSYGKKPTWNNSVNRQASWMVGDDITFNEQWSMLVGLSRATYRNKSRSKSTVDWETAYTESATSPTVSLIFKPVPSVTSYVTYMEALEQGGAAADVHNGQPVRNAGQVMAPLISKQVELGVKASVGDMLLTGALFQIDKGLQYYDVTNPASPVYVQDGRQVHRGLELTSTGRASSNLTLVGGLTLLDPRVARQKQDPALEGKRPVGTANRMFKMYGEYRISGAPGLSVNAGVSYVGASWADNRNTDRLPPYVLVDAGARYVVNAGDYPVTLRLNVHNLANKRYWVNSKYLGDARTVVLSANVKF